MAIPSKNVLGNPNVTEGNFQIAIEQLRESVIGSGKTYDSANTYMAYDICYYSGVVYYSKINNNIGNTPSIGANWGDYTDLLLGVVHKTGDETIAGVKTFTSSPIVPTPTTGTQVANKTYADTKQSKNEVAYDASTSSFIPNTLTSGAIIERGSNANGEYIKYADGTLICIKSTQEFTLTGVGLQISSTIPFPATFSSTQICSSMTFTDQSSAPVHENLHKIVVRQDLEGTGWVLSSMSSAAGLVILALFAIGRWK